MDHLIQTNRIVIYEVGSKKQVFNKDNLKYSNLDVSAVDQTQLSSTQDEYVLSDGSLVANKFILPVLYNPHLNQKLAINDIEESSNTSKKQK